VIGGIFFYIYLALFIFKKGYFVNLNPLLAFSFVNTKIDSILKKITKHINIFPGWALFIGQNSNFFTDIVIVAITSTNKKYEWIISRDLSVGNLKLNNRFFILSLSSHFKSNKKEIIVILKRAILQFAKENNEIIKLITITSTMFSIEKDKSPLEFNKFINKSANTPEKRPDFFWKNPEVPESETYAYKVL
jgi:hypothetical protein